MTSLVLTYIFVMAFFMATYILTYIFVMAAKKLNFYGEKRVNSFVKNTKFRFLSKMRQFFFFKYYSPCPSHFIDSTYPWLTKSTW